MSITYWLPCECGEQLRITSAQAGETVTCPSCSAQMDVPSLRLVNQLEPVERRARRRPRARWNMRKAWMAAGLVITGTSALAMIVAWALHPKPPDPSQLTLLGSWSMWMSLQQGLDRRVSWLTYQLIESREILRFHIYLCLAVGAVGLAITLTAFVLRRSPLAR